MYQISYFALFYAIAFGAIVIVLVVLIAGGFFHKNITKAPPKTTMDFLIEQVKTSNEDKEVLDAVMREFYANFYNISRENKHFGKWLQLIQEITILDYMSVEQAANFRDDLVKKNPGIKKEIEHSIGVSLKYREENKHKKK